MHTHTCIKLTGLRHQLCDSVHIFSHLHKHNRLLNGEQLVDILQHTQLSPRSLAHIHADLEDDVQNQLFDAFRPHHKRPDKNKVMLLLTSHIIVVGMDTQAYCPNIRIFRELAYIHVTQMHVYTYSIQTAQS